MLNRVSRSFAFVIQQLHPLLRDPVCIFYLVLRALDTVEDDMAVPIDEKVPILIAFHQHICDPDWKFVCGTKDYKDLMQRLHHVRHALEKLEPRYKAVILDITRRMGAGMASFITTEVETVPQYDEYCHYVAGLVGIGLSDLFHAANLEEAFEESLSNSMGLFLQVRPCARPSTHLSFLPSFVRHLSIRPPIRASSIHPPVRPSSCDLSIRPSTHQLEASVCACPQTCMSQCMHVTMSPMRVPMSPCPPCVPPCPHVPHACPHVPHACSHVPHACPHVPHASMAQKTNIIRDYLEDITEEPAPRMFWPKAIWGKYAARLEDFKDVGSNGAAAVKCVNELVTNALGHVSDCLTYMHRLRDPQVFRFCAIPQIMAMGTLALCYNNIGVFEGVVKMRKGLAAKVMEQTWSMADVRSSFTDFGFEILKKVDDSDPNSQQTRECIGKIIASCRTEGRLVRGRLSVCDNAKWRYLFYLFLIVTLIFYVVSYLNNVFSS
ncbi:unnamed protein product [Closterium sp. NIES-53]